MLPDIQKYINRKEIVSIYDNWNLSIDTALEYQLDELHEDLIQISFNGTYILDIGWYPEHQENGLFRCLLIRDSNWENPIYSVESKTIAGIVDLLTEMIECVFDFYLKN